MPAKGESKTKTSGAPSPAPESAKAEGAPQPSAEPKSEAKKTKRTKREIGGHVVYVDPPVESVTPVAKCSVHGVELVEGKCPEPHEGQGGWTAVAKKTGR